MLRAEATEAVRLIAATTGECDTLRAQVASPMTLIGSLTVKTEAGTADGGPDAGKGRSGAQKDK